MSDRTLKGVVGLLAAGILAVIALGAVFGSTAAADDLQDRSQSALTAAGLADVMVAFQGREAQLRGGNDVEIKLAQTVVSDLPGVRRVELDAAADDAIPGVARFELDRAGDIVQINGVVPDADDAAAIKIGVAAGLRIVITGDIAVDRSLVATGWPQGLPSVFEILGRVEDLEIDIKGDGKLILGGTVESSADRIRLAERVADAVPGLDVIDRFEGSEPAGKGR